MKLGYTAVLSPDGTSININSTIYCIDRIQNRAIASSQAITAFVNYIQNNINEIWTSSSNLGLQPPFNNSGVNVNCNVTTTRIYTPNLFNLLSGPGQTQLDNLIQSRNSMQPAFNLANFPGASIVVNIFAGAGRSNIEGGSGLNRLRIGNFFMNPNFYNGTNYHPHNGGVLEDNTPAHEFGHVMGLEDRYVSIANAFSLANQGFRRIARNQRAFVPMYLPGYYLSGPTAAGSPFTALNIGQEAYMQGLNFNPVNLNTSGTPLNMTVDQPMNILPSNVISPQPHYNNAPYDIEYNSRFGWEHNLMSRPISPNETLGRSDFFQINDPTYLQIYSIATSAADPANTHQTVIITTRQLNIILDPNATEDELAPDHITNQFVYVHNANNGNIDRTVNTICRGGNDPDIVASLNNFVSFAGVIYDTDDPDDFDLAQPVSDFYFNNNPSTVPYYGIGINDVMDYRISKVNTSSGTNENSWNLDSDTLFDQYGIYNPTFSNGGDRTNGIDFGQMSNQNYMDAIELGGVDVVNAIIGFNDFRYRADRDPFRAEVFGYFRENLVRITWDANGILRGGTQYGNPLLTTDAVNINYDLDFATLPPPVNRALLTGWTYFGSTARLRNGNTTLQLVRNHPFRLLMVDIILGQ